MARNYGQNINAFSSYSICRLQSYQNIRRLLTEKIFHLKRGRKVKSPFWKNNAEYIHGNLKMFIVDRWFVFGMDIRLLPSVLESEIDILKAVLPRKPPKLGPCKSRPNSFDSLSGFIRSEITVGWNNGFLWMTVTALMKTKATNWTTQLWYIHR